MMSRDQRLTVADLLKGKGSVQRTDVLVRTPDEAAAAAAAGIDLVTVEGGTFGSAFRSAAPHAFFVSGIAFGSAVTTDENLRAAFDLLNLGADAIYCVAGLQTLARLAQEGVPVISHVGLIPSKSTWTGGFRAVGKTADSAMAVWQHVKRLEDAGVFGAEIEVVPEAIATEISKRTRVFMISMGAGSGCDAQYLFAEDILGSHRGHYPRHSKSYRDFAADLDRLQDERVAAFREFAADVASLRFPQAEHLVSIADDELQKFRNELGPPESGTPPENEFA